MMESQFLLYLRPWALLVKVKLLNLFAGILKEVCFVWEIIPAKAFRENSFNFKQKPLPPIKGKSTSLLTFFFLQVLMLTI